LSGNGLDGDQVDVEVAVVVVVEDSGAGGHHLGLVEASGHAVEVDEVEPHLLRTLDEPVGDLTRR
jgi:hypothetical protein